jgi:beta-phosphoglucomutase family hydrolase
MDGTIVDSLPCHKRAWQATFSKRGRVFTEEDFEWANGRKNEEIIPHFMEKISPEEVNTIADEKEATFRRFVKENIKALPGAVELIQSLATTKMQLALVSSTPKENIELITEKLSIKKYFSLFINGGDVKEGKPSPRAFLLAAEKLGVEPKNCAVIEDAIVGVQAAKRAGMYCIAVTNAYPQEDISEADIVVNSLEEITVKTIEGLLSSPKK